MTAITTSSDDETPLANHKEKVKAEPGVQVKAETTGPATPAAAAPASESDDADDAPLASRAKSLASVKKEASAPKAKAAVKSEPLSPGAKAAKAKKPPPKKAAPKKPAAKKPAAKAAQVKKEAEVKAEGGAVDKKLRKVFEMPGQTRDTPDESDPLRRFYSSLHRQTEGRSEMAAKWMLQTGLLDLEEAEAMVERNGQAKAKGKTDQSPAKKPSNGASKKVVKKAVKTEPSGKKTGLKRTSSGGAKPAAKKAKK